MCKKCDHSYKKHHKKHHKKCDDKSYRKNRKNSNEDVIIIVNTGATTGLGNTLGGAGTLPLFL